MKEKDTSDWLHLYRIKVDYKKYVEKIAKRKYINTIVYSIIEKKLRTIKEIQPIWKDHDVNFGISSKPLKGILRR